MRPLRRALSPLLIALAAAAACADDLEMPTAATARPVAVPPSALRDPFIDLSDSYFSATVVTTTQFGELGDAAAAIGLPTTESEVVYVEGGYSADGSVRFGTWFEDEPRNPAIGSARLADGRVTLFDRKGTPMFSDLLENFLAMVGLPGASVDAAYFPFSPIPFPTCVSSDPSCGLTQQLRSLPPGATVSERGDLRELRWNPVAASGTAERAGGAQEIVQRYRRVSPSSGAEPEWRLEETSQAIRAAGGDARATLRRVSRVSYRQFVRNRVRDAVRAEEFARRAAERARRPVAAVPLRAAPLRATAGASTAFASVLGADGDPNALLGFCARGSGDFDRRRTEQRGLQVVYQHGFCSEASVFSDFDLRLSQLVPIERSRAFSLESTHRIDDQVNDLQARLVDKKLQPQVLIGHSQGGLVVRRYGQRNPAQTSAVITIGTPHRGANLAGIASGVVVDLMAQAMTPDCFVDAVCDLLTNYWSEIIAGRLVFGLDRAVPVFDNLRPGSPFSQQLNGTPELFQRAGIETVPAARWNLARMIGDDRSPASRLQQDRRPDGDAWVTDVQTVYAAMQWTHYVSQFLIFTVVHTGGGMNCSRPDARQFWPGCSGTTDIGGWYLPPYQEYLLYLIYELTGRITSLMDRVDRTWNHLVSGQGADSDGLVQWTSQRYPSAPGAHVPRRVTIAGARAEAHSGQPKSPEVVFATRELLSAFGLGPVQ